MEMAAKFVISFSKNPQIFYFVSEMHYICCIIETKYRNELSGI